MRKDVYTDEERQQARERMRRLRANPEYAKQDREQALKRMQTLRRDPAFKAVEVQRTRKWKQSNPEAYALQLEADKARVHANRVANPRYDDQYKALRDVPKIYTPEQWFAIVNYYCPDGRCLQCGEYCHLTVDHVVPLSKGGENAAHNLQPLCGSCNSSKNNRIADYRPDGGTFARSL